MPPELLTETECRYSNIERELLGVVFGLERLHHYTFGKPITVETDHQLLTSIWKKTIATSSPRLQRLLLRPPQYDVHIEYLRGKENCDSRHALSRVASHKPEPKDCNNSLSNIEKIPVHQITWDSTSRSRETARVMRGHSKRPNTKTTSRISCMKDGPKTIKDCPWQYTVLLVLQRWNYMWRWNSIQRNEIDNAQIRMCIHPKSLTPGALCGW